MSRRVTIATRGSALALWQAEHVKARLGAADPDLEVELLVVKTTGDKILDVPLAKVGGKGLFVKEIEEALLACRADLAVHSMKDVPATRRPGLAIAAISERADPRDALVTRDGAGLDALARGARVGTSSLRRFCQLKARRPDLAIESLRGNVPTRLARLSAGDFDAVVLAAAGLDRLGWSDRISERLPPEVCLPAVGQGALGIETRARADDAELIDLCRRAIDHEEDRVRVSAERAFLERIEGGCQAPLAAYAVLDGGDLVLDALIGRPDASEILRTRRRGPRSRALELGRAAAEDLLARGAAAILEELRRIDVETPGAP